MWRVFLCYLSIWCQSCEKIMLETQLLRNARAQCHIGQALAAWTHQGDLQQSVEVSLTQNSTLSCKDAKKQILCVFQRKRRSGTIVTRVASSILCVLSEDYVSAISIVSPKVSKLYQFPAADYRNPTRTGVMIDDCIFGVYIGWSSTCFFRDGWTVELLGTNPLLFY